MLSAVSEKLTEKAVKCGCIQREQYDEYLFAVNMITNILITDLTMVLIGGIMGMLWECIVFWLFYKILRKYCGGFHFSTSLKCYASSCVMCPIVLVAVKYVPYELYVWLSVAMVGSIILFMLSPVPAVNKPLDEKEFIMFGRVARILTVVVLSIDIIATFFGLHILSTLISISVICAAIYCIIGKIHLSYYGQE